MPFLMLSVPELPGSQNSWRATCSRGHCRAIFSGILFKAERFQEITTPEMGKDSTEGHHLLIISDY